METLRFAWRMLRRDLRAGELRILLIALLVAVASVSAVGFFTDRVRGAMVEQGAELLAADLVAEGPRALPPAWRATARDLGLETAATVSFRSVVLAGERVKLAEVKAVGPGYPLRGTLRIAARPFEEGEPTQGPPARGSVWVEQGLLQALALEVGARITLGDAGFTVAGVVAYEPDRGGEIFSIAPRLILGIDDLPATGLLGEGSLVQYRLLTAGPAPQVERLRAKLAPEIGPGQRLNSVRDARPELRSALDRAERFLGLAALASVLLAGVAVAIAARRHAARHLDTAALLRCLGAPQRFVLRAFMLELLGVALAGWLSGALLGWLAQAGIARLLAGLLAASLPPPGSSPLFAALAVALVTAAGFALPPLLSLREVPPLRVLRRDLLPLPPRALTVYGAAALALLGLMAWQASDLKLTAIVAGGSLAGIVALAAVGRALVAVLAPMRAQVGVAWRFGIGSLVRRPGTTVAQLTGFGLGILVLLLLSLVRSDLLEAWKGSLPPEAPNQFLINLQRAQLDPLQHFFAAHGRPAPKLWPMVRGRLTAINDRPVNPLDYPEGRERRLVEREFNLSDAAQPPAHNEITAGRWWNADANGEWSVEKGIAETLGIRLGDTLVFTVAGEARSGRVTSLRNVQWDSFQVNFFVIGPPEQMKGFAPSYITSFYLPPERSELLPELVRRFPNVTVVDVAAIMERVRAVMDRVTWAVEMVFAFTLLAGVTVLYAAIAASQEERRREAALLRTLGARHRQVLSAFTAEFATLGLLAGLLASTGATLIAWALATRVFELEFHFNPWVWAYGLLGGALGVGLAGLAGSRQVLTQPPLWSLRRAA